MSGKMHMHIFIQGIDLGSEWISVQLGDKSVGFYAGVAASSVGWWVYVSLWPLEMEEYE